MASLSIKNVPSEVIQRLRDRAARNHRSLQGELLALVREAAMAPDGHRPVTVPPSVPVRTGTKTLREILEENIARGIEPRDDLPLAVDIIRADRDAR